MSSAEYTQPTDMHNLYSNHNGWLRGWLSSRLRCPHTAADLTQDTFERVLTRDDMNTVKEPRAWLLTIAKRIMIDKSRRQKLEQAYLEECTVLAEQNPTCAPSSEDARAALQALEHIARALEQLSEKAQNAFILRNIDGLTLVDIASELNVSKTMVRKYLAQGLVACYNVLEGVE